MSQTRAVDIAVPGRCDQREHQRLPYDSRVGRTRIIIECPFCHLTCLAYVWSLAGGGKRCEGCGALHTSCGLTYKRTDKED